jgi:hypothetical protein
VSSNLTGLGRVVELTGNALDLLLHLPLRLRPLIRPVTSRSQGVVTLLKVAVRPAATVMPMSTTPTPTAARHAAPATAATAVLRMPNAALENSVTSSTPTLERAELATLHPAVPRHIFPARGASLVKAGLC